MIDPNFEAKILPDFRVPEFKASARSAVFYLWVFKISLTASTFSVSALSITPNVDRARRAKNKSSLPLRYNDFVFYE